MFCDFFKLRGIHVLPGFQLRVELSVLRFRVGAWARFRVRVRVRGRIRIREQQGVLTNYSFI